MFEKICYEFTASLDSIPLLHFTFSGSFSVYTNLDVFWWEDLFTIWTGTVLDCVG